MSADTPTFDLQSHSTHSEGALPPSEVVARAAAAGVELLALSDHDSVAGVAEAAAAAQEHGIRLSPAAELSSVHGEHEDLHILGWTGDYNDPGNFVGTFFGREKVEFGDKGMTEMFDAIGKADATVDMAAKKTAWEQVNRDIATKWMPAVPLWHAPPALVTTKNVEGLVPSPLTNEEFNTVTLTK